MLNCLRFFWLVKTDANSAEILQKEDVVMPFFVASVLENAANGDGCYGVISMTAFGESVL